MMGANFKLVGRCHPWCGNRELGVGRAAENRAWRRELEGESLNECGRFRPREGECYCGGDVVEFSGAFGACLKCVECGEVVMGTRIGAGDD